jgi:PHD/YefM family antitoxin component YafN of YafNO toxin-antitoxin module
METVKVGIREFRDNLSTYLLESETPMAITRHGDTVGYYVPARRKRTDADHIALQHATERLQASMAAANLTEDEIVEEFSRRRKSPVR